MKYITSADNNLIKIAASLKEKKYRQKYGLYVIEGWRAVKDAVEAGAEIECVFAEEGQQFDLYDATQEVYIVPSRLMEKICGTATPQGIAALARIKTPKLGALSWCLVLDRLSDPRPRHHHKDCGGLRGKGHHPLRLRRPVQPKVRESHHGRAQLRKPL